MRPSVRNQKGGAEKWAIWAEKKMICEGKKWRRGARQDLNQSRCCSEGRNQVRGWEKIEAAEAGREGAGRVSSVLNNSKNWEPREVGVETRAGGYFRDTERQPSYSLHTSPPRHTH